MSKEIASLEMRYEALKSERERVHARLEALELIASVRTFNSQEHRRWEIFHKEDKGLTQEMHEVLVELMKLRAQES